MSTERKLKVLIVDDDTFILNMYVAKFAREGHDVAIAKNGPETLAKLKDGEAPDIVLLDIVLPGMDGLQILAKAREEKLAPNAKYIMLTNQAGDEEMNTAKKLGVAGYIVKATFTPSEVVSKVLEITSRP